MQDFKAGRVPGTIMPQLAKGYTDEQIDRRRRLVRGADERNEEAGHAHASDANS